MLSCERNRIKWASEKRERENGREEKIEGETHTHTLTVRKLKIELLIFLFDTRANGEEIENMIEWKPMQCMKIQF